MTVAALAVMSACSAVVAAPPPPPRTPASAPRTPPAPVRVSFRLVDGVKITGLATSWDVHAIDGEFGRRRWSEIEIDDVRAVLRLLADEASADDWLARGAVLLRLEGGGQPAERALARALRLDPGAGPRIRAARAAAEAERRERLERQRAIEAEKLATGSPEAREWPASPWPPLTAEERRSAELAMKADGERILRETGPTPSPVRSEHFLVYADLTRPETVRWARRMDLTVNALAELLGVPDRAAVFWGPPVVFIFADRDRFRLVEAQAFRHLSPRTTVAVSHPRGPQVFVNAHRVSDDDRFESALLRSTVLAFMHRHRSPRRLPTWANEGLADAVAARMSDDSLIDRELRPVAHAYIRGGNPVDPVLDLTYGSGAWPGPESAARAVSYLLVDLMMADRPDGFARWVNAVKSGADWQPALSDAFGTPRAELVGRFARFYEVND